MGMQGGKTNSSLKAKINLHTLRKGNCKKKGPIKKNHVKNRDRGGKI